MITRWLVKMGLLVHCYRCNTLVWKHKAVGGYTSEDVHNLIGVPFCELCAEYLELEDCGYEE